jgi:hypothetical protein
MPSPQSKPASTEAPIINPEADAVLGRMAKRSLLTLLITMIVCTGVMAFANMPHTATWPYHRFLDFLAAAIVVVPFFYGMNKLYTERLRIGRELSERGEYRQAITALDPFAVPTQRFFDRTGEAHFLLSKAYTATNQRDKAEQCRKFVVGKRPGPWADKLKGVSSAPAVRISQIKGQDNRPRPSKSKPKRRF